MTAIEFNNISKQYRLGLVSTQTLSHDLNRWWTTNILRKEDPYLKIGESNDRAIKGNSEYVWALRDIDFKVEQGDVLGIIGKNGAGKSTLLKILSKVTAPTTGTIRARGRIASLLEVGTGFHPEMTGRENIYMNGAIMGMTKREIRSKLDEIIDFAGVERYIDTPTKRYSSGMTVRLGFAIAAHLDPEILVVDEVLAVGDAEFQKKAIGKMKDVSKGEGRTVLFVSHNMASIRALCTSGVLLSNGSVSMQGLIDDVIKEYMADSIIRSDAPIALLPRQKQSKGGVKVNNILYLDRTDNIIVPMSGEYCKIRLCFSLDNVSYNYCRFAITIRNMDNIPLLSLNTKFSKLEFNVSQNKTYIDCEIDKLPLTQGKYVMAVYVSSSGVCTDWIDSIIPFDVEDGDFYGTGKTVDNHFKGNLVLCEHQWRY